jgi:hypothetical protein
MQMRSTVRWFVVAVLTIHGLIHLLGAVKGFGWAEVSSLQQPIGVGLGLAWLGAAVLMMLAAGLLAGRVSWWWLVGAAALLASQSVIFTSWSDARAGTLANILLLLAALHGYASQGPRSLRARYRSQSGDALARALPPGGTVTDADLERLPPSVAAYLRRSGSVGQPRVNSFRARISGRIRPGADQPWMSFVGEQVNTFGPEPTRTFLIDATRSGIGIDVLHRFSAGRARMRVKVLSLVPIVDAGGPELDRAETVTVFNDLCVLAPAALVGAPIRWQELDARHVRGWFTLGDRTVAADLTFNADHDLVDFVSDDRLRSSGDGRSFTPQRWSTPIGEWREVGPRRVAVCGQARWHCPEPEGEFSYLEFRVADIAYNLAPAAAAGARSPTTAQHAPSS